jgi:hypothetical protein
MILPVPSVVSSAKNRTLRLLPYFLSYMKRTSNLAILQSIDSLGVSAEKAVRQQGTNLKYVNE